jgi:hypothetical protein
MCVVPSEFGLNVPSVAARVADGSAAPSEKGLFALLGAKHELEKYLDQLAAKHETFSWTGLSTGSFFDWVSRYMRRRLPNFYMVVGRMLTLCLNSR